MGYFGNGTDGEMYRAHYCDFCVNDRREGCPVWYLHLAWNDEAIKDETKRNALNEFIPVDANGENQQCRMFVEGKPPEKERHFLYGFCSESEPRLFEPIRAGEYIYFADGFIAFRVPASAFDPSMPECQDKALIESVLALFKSAPESGWKDFAGFDYSAVNWVDGWADINGVRFQERYIRLIAQLIDTEFALREFPEPSWFRTAEYDGSIGAIMPMKRV